MKCIITTAPTNQPILSLIYQLIFTPGAYARHDTDILMADGVQFSTLHEE